MQIVEWHQMATELAEKIYVCEQIYRSSAIKIIFLKGTFTSIFHVRHSAFMWRQCGNWTSENKRSIYSARGVCSCECLFVYARIQHRHSIFMLTVEKLLE